MENHNTFCSEYRSNLVASIYYLLLCHHLFYSLVFDVSLDASGLDSFENRLATPLDVAIDNVLYTVVQIELLLSNGYLSDSFGLLSLV